MEKYFMGILAVGIAITITAGVFSAYQLYRLVETDAKCREIKKPKLWGLLAASSNNQSGLLLYLIRRKKYPVISMTSAEKEFIKRCKKKIGVGIIFLAIGAIICGLGITLM